MTLVKIEVKASAIHGLGCFAAEPIAMGQLIWKFEGNYDHVLQKEFIETDSPGGRDHERLPGI
jgi:SET domain-containing protein